MLIYQDQEKQEDDLIWFPGRKIALATPEERARFA